MLFHQPIDFHADRFPANPAISAPDHRWSYAELVGYSHSIAGYLLAQGVSPGERIGILGLNSAVHFAIMLGASRIGAVTVVVNFRLAPAELAFILDDAEIEQLFVTDNSVDDAVTAVLDQRQGRTHLVAARADAHTLLSNALAFSNTKEPPELPFDEQAAVLQLYTSGTTGKPKGAVLSHRNMGSLTHMTSIGNDGIYTSDSVNLVVAPFFHIGGVGITYNGLAHGVHNIVYAAFDPMEVVETIQRDKVNSMFMVPAMIQAVVKMVPNVRDYDFSSLDIIAYGAAPISATLLEEAMEVFGCDFGQVYGMTETTGAVVSLPPEDHVRAVNGQPELLTSCGKGYPGCEIKIIDEDGKTVGPNTTGEICLRSASNMLGYHNRPEATESTIRDGWVLTGDAGYLDEAGYLYLRDRLKDMVVSGGENIYPVEVENVLAALPGVIEVAVIGIPDEQYGEALLAFFALQPNTSLSPDDMIAFCRDKLAGYKIPRQLEIVPALPRNPSGKVLKTTLREPYWQGIDRRIS